jgi:hypothetical protein
MRKGREHVAIIRAPEQRGVEHLQRLRGLAGVIQRHRIDVRVACIGRFKPGRVGQCLQRVGGPLLSHEREPQCVMQRRRTGHFAMPARSTASASRSTAARTVQIGQVGIRLHVSWIELDRLAVFGDRAFGISPRRIQLGEPAASVRPVGIVGLRGDVLGQRAIEARTIVGLKTRLRPAPPSARAASTRTARTGSASMRGRKRCRVATSVHDNTSTAARRTSASGSFSPRVTAGSVVASSSGPAGQWRWRARSPVAPCHR